MAFLEHAINLEDLPESTGDGEFKPLPAGWYNSTINKAELKATKDGTGQYIAIRYDITGPTHQGRVVFGNVNIRNKSEKAEEIGRAQLGDIMRALGLKQVTDTDQLIGGALQIKLDIKTDEQYGTRNEVKGYKAAEGSAGFMKAEMGCAAIPSSAMTQTRAATGSAPPWAKK
jgi:hypothetical protein